MSEQLKYEGKQAEIKEEKPPVLSDEWINSIRFGVISTADKLPELPSYVSVLLRTQRDADIAWFKQEVGRLEVLGDEKIGKLIWNKDGEVIDSNLSHIGRTVARAQLQDIYDRLLKLQE